MHKSDTGIFEQIGIVSFGKVGGKISFGFNGIWENYHF